MSSAPSRHSSPEVHACCASSGQPPLRSVNATRAAAHGSHGTHAGWRAAANVTVHCLTGCAIGELLGLAIGVGLGWPPRQTVALAVALSFLSGFALTLLPMLRRGFGLLASLQTVWLGEVISISAMELVMNLVDFQMGGMRGVSLASPRYWEAFAVALVAGYLAAWPVNAWMLRRNMKRCH